MNEFKTACSCLPRSLRAMLDKLPLHIKQNATEIVMRKEDSFYIVCKKAKPPDPIRGIHNFYLLFLFTMFCATKPTMTPPSRPNIICPVAPPIAIPSIVHPISIIESSILYIYSSSFQEGTRGAFNFLYNNSIL